MNDQQQQQKTNISSGLMNQIDEKKVSSSPLPFATSASININKNHHSKPETINDLNKDHLGDNDDDNQRFFACEYGTIRKYSIKTIIEWKLSSSSSLNIDPKQQNQQIRSTIVMKCLNHNTDSNSKYFHYKFIKNTPIISNINNINNDNDDDINVNMEHGCIDCVNPFSKISLPFWFIQLSDGTIPEIRFLKQDTNLNIKNWKKYLLNQPVQTLKISNISNNNRILNKLEKHIENFTDNNNNDNDDTNQSPITTIDSNQTIHFDRQHIIDSSGNYQIKFNQQNEFWPYLDGHLYYNLKIIPLHNIGKHDDSVKLLNEHFLENTKDETLVAQQNKRESILMEKYTKLLSKIRSRLGKNEYRYYTTLYEAATSKMNSQEHDSLLTLITLEQQLNHTVHSYNSIIGDIRRIGTAHNIQLVCGVNLIQIISNENCQAFIMLLLKCSSKTAQRDLLYALENIYVNSNLTIITDHHHQRKIDEFVTRLLPYTQRSSRWFIENLLHVLYRRQQMNIVNGSSSISTTLLQSLTLLAQNEQLIKLNEILSNFILKRIDDLLIVWNDNLLKNQTLNSNVELIYLVDLIKIQEIVQLLIDNVDRIFIEQQTKRFNENYNDLDNDEDEKRWPKYNFNQLDEILAQNLRNSSNNCVHHLIIEYFRRKSNKKSKNYLNEYEIRQNYNSLSFDFCLSEILNVKCDYVQKIGNDIINMIIKKSILLPKLQLSSIINQSSIIYTKYSIDLNLSSSTTTTTSLSNHNKRLTLGHLNVYETFDNDDDDDENYVNNHQLRMEFDSYNGQTLSLGYWNISSIKSNLAVDNDKEKSSLNKTSATESDIIQIKLNIPTIILWSKRYLHQLLYSETMNTNILITLKLINLINDHKQPQPEQQPQPTSSNIDNDFRSNSRLNHAKKQLKINFDIKTNVELMANSLAWKNSVELEIYSLLWKIHLINNQQQQKHHHNLHHESHHLFDSNLKNLTIIDPSSSSSSSDLFIENSLQYLGSEWFHHEIELFREFYKRFDTQCNQWIDESYRQTILFWNSSLIQRNLLSLSLYEGQPDNMD
ncbi:hypothetical protein DERP_003074 [Dermatophagoides pteronyssinus]|uniref:Uncharacterized protein n=1 Tax=Dermatophagoides pteronyssinus TaxID=6956 RepID=A0ABQ8JIH4_DERPT|nr:hypothetical protein DERP_003074 [Dermatophagoides pteronyssinus]